MDQNKKERIFWIDNLRAFLIICVVFGHLLKTIFFPGGEFLYIFIYFFHMPAMVFLSGLCAKDKVNVKGISKRIVLPYLIFQILLFLIDFFLLGNSVGFSLLTPDWIMWYMMSLLIWSLIIPFFKTESKKKRIILFSISVLVALLVGFIDWIGLFLSLSRTIVFFPFFLSGFYSKEKMKREGKRKKRILIPVFILALVSFLFIILFYNNIRPSWLYHWKSYSISSYNIVLRAIILSISAIFAYVLYVTAINKKIPYITYLGRNTITVYLLHGLIVRIFRAYQDLFEFINPALLSIILTVIIVLISANPLTEKIWIFFFGKRRSKENG